MKIQRARSSVPVLKGILATDSAVRIKTSAQQELIIVMQTRSARIRREAISAVVKMALQVMGLFAKISTSARRKLIIVTKTHRVRILWEASIARATAVSLEME